MSDKLGHLPPFPGIRQEGLDFLLQLKDEKHQDRSWFNARKHLYTDELHWPMHCLVADILRRSAAHPVVRLYGDPRKSVFRIYRDIRFSKNKHPYKTNVSCRFTVDPGLTERNGLVYVHIEPPEQSFVAAGIYVPSVKRLRPIRLRMIHEPAAWQSVLDRLDEAGLEPEGHGDDLKGMPQGFAEYRDSDVARYLKWTSLLVSRPLEAEQIRTPALSDAVMSFAEDAWPLLQFISEAR